MSEDIASSLEEAIVQFEKTPYVPIRLVHKSQSAATWIAKDTKVGRLVVIKRWDPVGYVSLKAFAHEAKILRELSHPGVVGLIASQLSLDGPGPYHVLDHITGTPANLLRGAHQLKTTDLIRFGISVCEALQHLHQRDILHGDIKPDNIIWDGYRATLVDFGCARHADHPVPQLDLLEQRGSDAYFDKIWTPTGQQLGTLNYLAPELLRGETVDPRADLFSLGVTLFWLAMDYRPFVGGTADEIIRQILTGTPTVLGSSNCELDDIIMGLLVKDRNERYQSATALKRDLEPLIQHLA